VCDLLDALSGPKIGGGANGGSFNATTGYGHFGDKRWEDSGLRHTKRTIEQNGKVIAEKQPMPEQNNPA